MDMFLDSKKILITGGTGSLGKALLSRAELEDWNTEFVIFSRDETKQSLLKKRFPQHKYVLGDVAKYRDIYRALKGVQVVFHFAAYKQVPSAQNNIPATIETNVTGAQTLVDAAIDAGVQKVVASSTDKACACVNAYGASKFIMESIFQHANNNGDTTFHLARYGNVIYSNGSVCPLFEQQVKQGGPLTITSEKMTRFWMTIDQAVDTILFALRQDAGIVSVPKIKAMSLLETAKAIGPTTEIKITGIRAGEKIHEDLISEAESFRTEVKDGWFLIHPHTSRYLNSLAPFTYRSCDAERMSAGELLEAIKEYHKYHE